MRTKEQEQRYKEMRRAVEAATNQLLPAYMECLKFFKTVGYEEMTKKEKLVVLFMLTYIDKLHLMSEEVKDFSELKEYFEPKFNKEIGE